MDEYISRQAAIDGKISIQLADGVEIYSDEAVPVEYLKRLPSAQPEQRWIPCSEKPPEEGSYLVWMPWAPPKHRIAVAEYCGGYWNIKTPISAWMLLPEPYGGNLNE